MRFGICGSMVAYARVSGPGAQQPDGSGIEIVEQARELGYDYIELSLAHMSALSNEQFAALRRRVEASGLACEACNYFYPGSVRLTGAQVDWERVRAYTHLAVGRAAELGVRVIVFGSSAAKNVPEGFPMHRAWQQIVRVLRLAADEVQPHGITIAIEPLNRQESNIVNNAAEGLALMQRVNRPEVRLLADYYHMALEHEDYTILRQAGTNLRHVHIARVDGRTYPQEMEEDFISFFTALRSAGYSGRVSVEGFSNDFERDAARALELLRRLAPARLEQ